MGIPVIHGSMRIAGNVIWARPLIEKRQKERAGKGGGGHVRVVSLCGHAAAGQGKDQNRDQIARMNRRFAFRCR